MYKIEDLPSADEIAATMEQKCGPYPYASYEYQYHPTILPIALCISILVLSALLIRKNGALMKMQAARVYSLLKNHGLAFLLVILVLLLGLCLSPNTSKRVRAVKRETSRITQQFYTTTRTETDSSREARRVWNRCAM